MNADRRVKLNKAQNALSEAKEIIEEIQGEEQEAFDNMPEGLQSSDKGQRAEEIISYLEDAANRCDEALTNVQEACT